ncbi:hypothetical protein P775_13770 [Puniceibacterium antarcticum]|uniref:STAS domain-containing protein n=2 Tax=Puniceibacterium antarcticum TaxID=1206336 RepID=A0A2G8RDG0_9RHOB|nr:hypothetical protein P775_13770 [Puniceibacterium antarcticum]
MLLMEQDQDITINVELVEKFDAITVQLLYSAHLYAREKGSQISVAFGESQALPKILGELGCLAPGPGQACVELNKWVGISE